MTDVQERASAVLNKCLHDPADLGLSPDQSSALLVVQGSVRIEDQQVLHEVQRFVAALKLPDPGG